MTRPETTCGYRNYMPPINANAAVRRLLECVPDEFLTGLDRIVLTNSSGAPRSERRQRIWSRQHRKSHLRHAAGLYHPNAKGQAAWIEVFVDKIFENVPRLVCSVSLVRDLFLAKVIYHEIGHHVQLRVRPQRGNVEALADAWARHLTLMFVREKYWYTLPILNAWRIVRHRKATEQKQ